MIATDAPLLPHQCERLAQRAGLGIARAGGTGGHSSGDLFIAFATGNRVPAEDEDRPRVLGYDVRVAGDGVVDALFDGVIEATEEAIINAIVAAETMVGRDGVTAHAIPHDRAGRGHDEVRARAGAELRAGRATSQTAARPNPEPQPAATGAGFSIGTPIRLPYSVHEPS